MLIELEKAKPNFDRWWVTGGFDDFLQAARRWEAMHRSCGDGLTTAHLWNDDDEIGSDDVRRVWFHCDACERRLLVLGPPTGREMRPLFPRVQ
jgi:hypothetical protein